VEVELDDDEHGYSIGERLRALDLDDKARERLGGGLMVTRDGPRLFLYAASEAQAREAEHVVRSLVEADELTAEIRVTRWHPVEEAWKDVSIPLPSPGRPRSMGSTTGTSSSTCRDGMKPSSSQTGSWRRVWRSRAGGDTSLRVS